MTLPGLTRSLYIGHDEAPAPNSRYLGSATRASDYATTKDLEFPIAKYPP